MKKELFSSSIQVRENGAINGGQQCETAKTGVLWRNAVKFKVVTSRFIVV
jgi:hypothetical protein